MKVSLTILNKHSGLTGEPIWLDSEYVRVTMDGVVECCCLRFKYTGECMHAFAIADQINADGKTVYEIDIHSS